MCKHFFENLGSAFIPGYGEKKAADAQTAATERGIGKENEIFAYNKANIAPWMQGGQNAFMQYNNALGLGGGAGDVTNPVAGFGGVNAAAGGGAPSYGGFQQSPGYQFAYDQGMRGVNNAFAARGMLNSGARMKGLERYGQGIADQEFNNYLAQLMGSAQIGANALNLNTQTASGYANDFANLWQNKGAAQASRYAGIANAFQDFRGPSIAKLFGGGQTSGFGGGGGGSQPSTFSDDYGNVYPI